MQWLWLKWGKWPRELRGRAWGHSVGGGRVSQGSAVGRQAKRQEAQQVREVHVGGGGRQLSWGERRVPEGEMGTLTSQTFREKVARPGDGSRYGGLRWHWPALEFGQEVLHLHFQIWGSGTRLISGSLLVLLRRRLVWLKVAAHTHWAGKGSRHHRVMVMIDPWGRCARKALRVEHGHGKRLCGIFQRSNRAQGRTGLLFNGHRRKGLQILCMAFFKCRVRWSRRPKRWAQRGHRKSRLPVCTTAWRLTSLRVKKRRPHRSHWCFLSRTTVPGGGRPVCVLRCSSSAGMLSNAWRQTLQVRSPLAEVACVATWRLRPRRVL